MTHTRNLSHATNNYEPKERIILQTLRQVGSLSRQSLCILTGIPINSVTVRVHHLLEIGAIELCGSERNQDTGKLNELVRVVRRRSAL